MAKKFKLYAELFVNIPVSFKSFGRELFGRGAEERFFPEKGSPAIFHKSL